MKELLIGCGRMHEECQFKGIVEGLLKGMRTLQDSSGGIHGEHKEREVGVLALSQKNNEAEDINVGEVPTAR